MITNLSTALATLAISLYLSLTTLGLPIAKPTLHIFGDSLSDTGRLHSLTYGMVPPKSYWKGRFSSGPVWNEHLAQLLNMDLGSHAVGVAKSISAHRRFLNLIPLDPPNTIDQILEFQNTYSSLSSIYHHDIAVLEVGSNDAASALIEIASGQQSVDEFVQRLSDNVIAQLGQLKVIGFKHILVINLPALQHTPIVKQKHRESIATVVVSTYNSLLETKAREWQLSAGLDHFAVIDLARFMDTAIQPAVSTVLNITDTQSFCVGGSWLSLFDDQISVSKFLRFLLSSDSKPMCTDPSSHFFFDPIHPTDRVHRLFGYCAHQIIARQIARLPPFVFTKESLIALIAKHKLGVSTL
ncbi:hypothetical protein GGH94_000821 [Coemansia aciculifera]|uniref:SGNH hydrolase n=1 Tax=Coemansia aciculifera TaxID=417176 RepID=A0A9W8M891_9FUNG|nr:hypothetical protein GGH94_000821 [Coemansia aciculifera]